MVMKKSYSREFESSPAFTWTNNAVILPGADITVSWGTHNARSQKYLPFNFTRVINNSGQEIILYPNQDLNSPIHIPNGTISSMDRGVIPAMSSFRIQNNGIANITANQIVLSNSREGVTSDSVVSRLHKRLLGGL